MSEFFWFHMGKGIMVHEYKRRKRQFLLSPQTIYLVKLAVPRQLGKGKENL